MLNSTDPFMISIKNNSSVNTRHIPVWLVGLIGCVITSLVLIFIANNKNSLAYQSFHTATEKISGEIEDQFKTSTRAVYHLASFYQGDDSITRDEFNHYVEGFIKHYPEIHALEWIPRLFHKQRALYERQQSAYKHNFHITQKHVDNGMIPASKRDIYFPVTYIYPMQGNESAFGFDLASNKDRRIMIEQAIINNDVTISSGIKLVQEKGNSHSVLIALPITQQDKVSQTIDDVHLKGIVLGVYRINSIMSTIGRLIDFRHFNIQITDQSKDSENTLLYQHTKIKLSKNNLHYTQLLKIANRQWRVEISSDPKLFGAYTITDYLIIIVIGLGFTALLIAYIRLIHTSGEQSYRISEQLAHAVNMRRDYERKLIESNSKLEALSLEDSLMKIANRRAFDDYIMDEWKRAQRSGAPLSLILADIDNFKKFNDKYGHVVGDQCLRKVADAFKDVIKRPSDLVARYGGEEIAVILPETTSDGARKVAESIRLAVIEQCIPHGDSDVRSVVTISIGVTVVVNVSDFTVAEIINLADDALYTAKQNGKNRVEHVLADNRSTVIEDKTRTTLDKRLK
ncbi:MAG: diguanylate cyclase [Gammaproteobacteria bacterium]|nr:diguanylate cyclase [Gammaproteobacteria bacterium]